MKAIFGNIPFLILYALLLKTGEAQDDKIIVERINILRKTKWPLLYTQNDTINSEAKCHLLDDDKVPSPGYKIVHIKNLEVINYPRFAKEETKERYIQGFVEQIKGLDTEHKSLLLAPMYSRIGIAKDLGKGCAVILVQERFSVQPAWDAWSSTRDHQFPLIPNNKISCALSMEYSKVDQYQGYDFPFVHIPTEASLALPDKDSIELAFKNLALTNAELLEEVEGICPVGLGVTWHPSSATWILVLGIPPRTHFDDMLKLFNTTKPVLQLLRGIVEDELQVMVTKQSTVPHREKVVQKHIFTINHGSQSLSTILTNAYNDAMQKNNEFEQFRNHVDTQYVRIRITRNDDPINNMKHNLKVTVTLLKYFGTAYIDINCARKSQKFDPLFMEIQARKDIRCVRPDQCLRLNVRQQVAKNKFLAIQEAIAGILQRNSECKISSEKELQEENVRESALFDEYTAVMSVEWEFFQNIVLIRLYTFEDWIRSSINIILCVTNVPEGLSTEDSDFYKTIDELSELANKIIGSSDITEDMSYIAFSEVFTTKFEDRESPLQKVYNYLSITSKISAFETVFDFEHTLGVIYEVAHEGENTEKLPIQINIALTFQTFLGFLLRQNSHLRIFHEVEGTSYGYNEKHQNLSLTVSRCQIPNSPTFAINQTFRELYSGQTSKKANAICLLKDLKNRAFNCMGLVGNSEWRTIQVYTFSMLPSVLGKMNQLRPKSDPFTLSHKLTMEAKELLEKGAESGPRIFRMNVKYGSKKNINFAKLDQAIMAGWEKKVILTQERKKKNEGEEPEVPRTIKLFTEFMLAAQHNLHLSKIGMYWKPIGEDIGVIFLLGSVFDATLELLLPNTILYSNMEHFKDHYSSYSTLSSIPLCRNNEGDGDFLSAKTFASIIGSAGVEIAQFDTEVLIEKGIRRIMETAQFTYPLSAVLYEEKNTQLRVTLYQMKMPVFPEVINTVNSMRPENAPPVVEDYLMSQHAALILKDVYQMKSNSPNFYSVSMVVNLGKVDCAVLSIYPFILFEVPISKNDSLLDLTPLLKSKLNPILKKHPLVLHPALDTIGISYERLMDGETLVFCIVGMPYFGFLFGREMEINEFLNAEAEQNARLNESVVDNDILMASTTVSKDMATTRVQALKTAWYDTFISEKDLEEYNFVGFGCNRSETTFDWTLHAIWAKSLAKIKSLKTYAATKANWPKLLWCKGNAVQPSNGFPTTKSNQSEDKGTPKSFAGDMPIPRSASVPEFVKHAPALQERSVSASKLEEKKPKKRFFRSNRKTAKPEGTTVESPQKKKRGNFITRLPALLAKTFSLNKDKA